MTNKHVKAFESFVASQPQTQPEKARPGVAEPLTKPPATKPGVKPTRRNPARRHQPGVEPKPKAELKDVLERLEKVATNELRMEFIKKLKR